MPLEAQLPLAKLPVTTLFLCYGNVARSQMAQGWYNHYTGSRRGLSAGVSTTTFHLFRRPTNEAITVMREEGIDISRHRAKPLTPQLLKRAQQVVVLCQPSDCPDSVHQHRHVIYNPIEDPFGKNLEVYREVREQIRQFILTLV